MISALANYDMPTAVGILARAAFAVEDDGNPASRARLPEEFRVREAIFDEVRRKVGISREDQSAPAIELIGKALDEEIDTLSAPDTDPDQVLDQLGLKGELPSDLYKVEVASNVRDVYKKHETAEILRIRETVANADREERLGLPVGPGEDPRLVALFSKVYSYKNPYDNFTLLVAAQPANGRELRAYQAWRLYPDAVSFSGSEKLIDLLRRFCDVYGMEFEVNGVRSKFALELEIPAEPTPRHHINVLPLYVRDSKGRKVEKNVDVTVNWFAEFRPGQGHHALLVTAINMTKYTATLSGHGW